MKHGPAASNTLRFPPKCNGLLPRTSLPDTFPWMAIGRFATATIRRRSRSLRANSKRPSRAAPSPAFLRRANTALDVAFRNRIAGELPRLHQREFKALAPNSPDAIRVIAGSARWEGKIAGPSGPPVFSRSCSRRARTLREAGRLIPSKATSAYSPEKLTLARGRDAPRSRRRRDRGTSLHLTDWSFLPENNWSADVSVRCDLHRGAPAVLGLVVSVRGQANGPISRPRHPRRRPASPDLFDLADGDVYGVCSTGCAGSSTSLPTKFASQMPSCACLRQGRRQAAERASSLERPATGSPIKQYLRRSGRRVAPARELRKAAKCAFSRGWTRFLPHQGQWSGDRSAEPTGLSASWIWESVKRSSEASTASSTRMDVPPSSNSARR